MKKSDNVNSRSIRELKKARKKAKKYEKDHIKRKGLLHFFSGHIKRLQQELLKKLNDSGLLSIFVYKEKKELDKNKQFILKKGSYKVQGELKTKERKASGRGS